MSMIHRPIPLVALAGLAIAGCNDDVPFLPLADASGSDAASDGGTNPDGGVLPDGGTADTGDDAGPVVDVGPAPDTGSDAAVDMGLPPDAGTGSLISEAIAAYCQAFATCEGEPDLAARCASSFGQIEQAFAAQTENCQQAVLAYMGCAATSDDACYEEYGETYFDGERGCEQEYTRQDAACPDDY